MNRSEEQLPFKIETTADGSPTLRLENGGESMHHSGGAASETCYIYQSVIEQAYQILPDSSTCVVGLGLGYIEICWALSVLAKPGAGGSLTSFEINETLKNDFVHWVEDHSSFDREKKKLYEDVYRSIQKVLMRPIEDHLIRQRLRENFEKHKIQADLRRSLRGEKKWNIICYDAFSSKTNTDLWTDSFLQNFLTSGCAWDCVFTTYACTGALKKALSFNGFHVIKRPGFQGKRDSTLALRGIFTQGFQSNFSQIF